MTLRELIVDQPAAQCPESAAFVIDPKDNGKDITAQQFKNDLDAVSQGLLNDSMTGIMGVYGSDSYPWILMHTAIIASGNIAAAMDKQMNAEQLAEHMARVDASTVFYTETHAETAKAAVSLLGEGYRAVSIEEYLELCRKAKERTSTPLVQSINDTCAIFFTSGTTGRDRAVMLSQDNIITDVLGSVEAYPENAEVDRYLSLLPLHHCYGYTVLLFHLAQSIPVCFCPNLRRLTKYFKAFKPKKPFVVPQMLEVLLKLRKEGNFMDTVQEFVVGGAHCPEQLIHAYHAIGIPVYVGYGITECSPVIALNRRGEAKIGSAGKPYSINELKTIDGEIVVKGRNVFQGYYKDEAATAAAFTPDGWFKTGDLGYIKDGCVYITGRLKNLIITANGENVSPEELEEKIGEIPFVAENLVYEDHGVICADVLLTDEYKSAPVEDMQIKLEDAVQAINSALPLYKQIQRVQIRTTPFPKTSTQKIKRTEALKQND